MASSAELVMLFKANTSEAIAAIDGLHREMKSITDDMWNIGKQAGIMGVAIVAALGFAAKAGFDEAAGIARLSVMVKSLGMSYVDVEDDVEKLINTLAEKTNYSDDEQRQALSELIIILGDYDKAMQALPTVLDAAAASGSDATSMANTLGRALAGQTDTLRTLGIEFVKDTSFAERLNLVISKVGGTAEAAADPFTQLKKEVAEFFETAIKPALPAIKDFLDWMKGIITSVKEWTEKHPNLTKALVIFAGVLGIGGVVGGALASMAKGLTNIVGLVKSLISLLPKLAGINLLTQVTGGGAVAGTVGKGIGAGGAAVGAGTLGKSIAAGVGAEITVAVASIAAVALTAVASASSVFFAILHIKDGLDDLYDRTHAYNMMERDFFTGLAEWMEDVGKSMDTIINEDLVKEYAKAKGLEAPPLPEGEKSYEEWLHNLRPGLDAEVTFRDIKVNHTFDLFKDMFREVQDLGPAAAAAMNGLNSAEEMINFLDTLAKELGFEKTAEWAAMKSEAEKALGFSAGLGPQSTESMWAEIVKTIKEKGFAAAQALFDFGASEKEVWDAILSATLFEGPDAKIPSELEAIYNDAQKGWDELINDVKTQGLEAAQQIWNFGDVQEAVWANIKDALAASGFAARMPSELMGALAGAEGGGVAPGGEPQVSHSSRQWMDWYKGKRNAWLEANPGTGQSDWLAHYNQWKANTVPSLAAGGTILGPGPVGAPVPIIAHVGEQYLGVGGNARGGNVTIVNQNKYEVQTLAFTGDQASLRRLARMIDELNQQDKRRRE